MTSGPETSMEASGATVYESPGTPALGRITVFETPVGIVAVEAFTSLQISRDEKNEDVYIAECRSFRMAGTGNNQARARQDLQRKLESHLETMLHEAAEALHAELVRLGWKKVSIPSTEVAAILAQHPSIVCVKRDLVGAGC